MPEIIIGGVLVTALIVYALTGGADFGGGVWDLFSSGPTKQRQQRLIADSIGPIWEANHVWLIVVVVLLFVCFPRSFAAVSTALHLPLIGLLVGIVLRGSSFVFRSYDVQHEPQAQAQSWRRWSSVFAVSSTFTPVFLGITLGAVARGIPMGPEGVQTDFFSDWLAPFPLAVGVLVLVLFAFLAAVYLAVDAGDEDLKEAFRKRGLIAQGVLFVVAFATLFAARMDAPALWETLTSGALGIGLQVAIGAVAVLASVLLYQRRYKLARWAAGAQVTAMILGWALSHYPYVLPPDLSIHDAAPANVLWGVIGALGAGALVLVPSFWWLYRVFKAEPLPSSK